MNGVHRVEVLEGLEAIRMRPGMWLKPDAPLGLCLRLVRSLADFVQSGVGDCALTLFRDGAIAAEVSDASFVPTGVGQWCGISQPEILVALLLLSHRQEADPKFLAETGPVLIALSDYGNICCTKAGKLMSVQFSRGGISAPVGFENSSGPDSTRIIFRPDPAILGRQQFELDDVLRGLGAGFPLRISCHRTAFGGREHEVESR